MTVLPLINSVSFWVTILIGIFLAFWVYSSNRKNKINQFFFLLTIAMILYLSFSYVSHYSNNYSIILFFKRLFLSAVSLFIIFSYLFSIHFPEKKRGYPILDIIVVSTEIILVFLLLGSNFIIKEIRLESWGTNVIFGQGKYVFFLTMILFSSLLVGQIFRKYFQISKEKKIQVQYFLVGVLIFAIANITFNMVFPIWKNTYEYHYIGDFSAVILLGLTAYAIVKRELFGIRVVLTQILVGVIAIVLLVQALGSATIFEYIWKGAVFLVFLFFGFLLIRSVMREIKLREALQQAYAKLQVLDKAKSEFISIASHQLRTPLTAIKGYISMILEGSYGEIPEKAQRPVENVYKSAERLINLVNDLLSVSRLEAGKIKVEPKKVCIEEIILGIIEELKIKADEKKIYLKFQQPLNPLPKVIIDPDKIRQVILNIIDNAIRYTITGGITVEAEIEAGKLRVVISDTGEGMTREERSHLFESFSRGAAGGRLWTEGSGLGLYVSRRFVEMHHGKVWVESEGKGKGSSFYIELPRRFGNNENFDRFMKSV